jgi:hypothetical protein
LYVDYAPTEKILREYSSHIKDPFKKFANTGTIDRYTILWSVRPTRYIKNTYSAPIILDTDLRKFNSRRYQQACQKKIIIGGMTKVLECALDRGNILAGKSTVIVLGQEEDLKYALAILNSKLISFWYQIYYRSLSLAGGFIRISSNEIKTVPMPQNQGELRNNLIRVVDQILAVKRANPAADTPALEREIDGLVYQLYGLTEEEITVVEAGR